MTLWGTVTFKLQHQEQDNADLVVFVEHNGQNHGLGILVHMENLTPNIVRPLKQQIFLDCLRAADAIIL